jgi:hypothetical protein
VFAIDQNLETDSRPLPVMPAKNSPERILTAPPSALARQGVNHEWFT